MANENVKRASVTLQDPAAGYRFAVETGRGGRALLDNSPDGGLPTPVEMLLAALGGCTGMDVIGILRKKRQDVRHYEVVVTGEQREALPRRLVRVEVVHRLQGRDIHSAAVEEAIHLSETKYCPVHASLDRDIEITSRYEIIPV